MVACLTMHHVEEKLLKRIRHMYSKYSDSVYRKQADESRNLSLIFSIDFLPPFLLRLFSLFPPPFYSPFYFFTYLSFVCCLFFQFEDRYFGRHCLARFVHVFLFFILFFFSSSPFSLFIDGVALMPHSSPIGVKYGLAIGT